MLNWIKKFFETPAEHERIMEELDDAEAALVSGGFGDGQLLAN